MKTKQTWKRNNKENKINNENKTKAKWNRNENENWSKMAQNRSIWIRFKLRHLMASQFELNSNVKEQLNVSVLIDRSIHRWMNRSTDDWRYRKRRWDDGAEKRWKNKTNIVNKQFKNDWKTLPALKTRNKTSNFCCMITDYSCVVGWGYFFRLF